MATEQGIYFTTDDKMAKGQKLKQFTYHWQHIPGMTSGKHTIYCYSLSDLKKLINIWNSDQPDTWRYWL